MGSSKRVRLLNKSSSNLIKSKSSKLLKNKSWDSIASTSLTLILTFLPPKSIYLSMILLSKNYNNHILLSNFIFAYFKNTLKYNFTKKNAKNTKKNNLIFTENDLKSMKASNLKKELKYFGISLNKKKKNELIKIYFQIIKNIFNPNPKSVKIKKNE